jgi:hypothetical protein
MAVLQRRDHILTMKGFVIEIEILSRMSEKTDQNTIVPGDGAPAHRHHFQQAILDMYEVQRLESYPSHTRATWF